MSSSSLIKGTLVLTAASVFCRILGLGNRMLLSRLIGAEGLGLLQMILPFYTLAAVLVTLGLPGAVVKTVSDRFSREDLYGIHQVRSAALRMIYPASFLVGLVLLGVTFSPLSAYVPDERILLPLRLLPPALLCVAAASIYKGFFQGQQNMVPTALSQMVEQVSRVTFGLLGIFFLLSHGLEYAILGVVAGITLGEGAGLSVLLLFYRLQSKKTLPIAFPLFPWQVKKELITLALPLLIIRLSASLTFTVESFLIPARLQAAGYSAAEATILLGQLLGMALPLLFLPTVFIIPLSTAMVPSIARAASLGQKKRLKHLINYSLGSAFALGMVAGAVVYSFAEPLTLIIYSTSDAAPLLAAMALASPFAYLQFVTASVLHGLGRPQVALINDLLGTSVCFVLIYSLTANPAFGIQGAIWGLNTGFMISAVSGAWFSRHFGSRG